jgi:hypothetical protein
MKNEIVLFSLEQGNLLIRLLLAHIISDFVLQTTKMVANKKWFSKYMLIHIFIIFGCTLVLSGLWKTALVIAVSHWLIDSMKMEIQKQNKYKQRTLFFVDQLLHFLIIVVLWFWHFKLFDVLCKTISFPFLNYKISLILLAYILVIYPVGYLIKFATQNILQQQTNAEPNLEHGGKLIGQFERIIILTLVLLNQYEAIGFLITGKSIIRFADHNSNIRSEYVLVGTMMSYAFAIITGVLVNYLLSVS